MNRWVGLGVIADNVVNIGRAIEKQHGPLTAPAPPNSCKPAGHPRRVAVAGRH